MRQERAAASEAATYYNALLEAREGLDLRRGFRDRSMPSPEPSDEEMRAILAQMGKHQPEDELNCGACGYVTCREKAVAVYQGLAEAQMCLPFLIDELETTVEQLAESKLEIEKAQSLLLQSERLASMGQLAAAVAHELNNPLGTVLIYAHTLLRELEQGDPRHAGLEMIAAESERCRKIVRGLLDFARQRSRRAEAVAIPAVIQGVLAIVQKHRVFDNVRTQLDLSPELPLVDGDPDQLTQAFVNLAINAAEAMPNGGQLTISARPRDDRVEVAFRDQGVGIPEKHHGRLFTPFFTTKPTGKGTGLGLPIVYGVVKDAQRRYPRGQQGGQGDDLYDHPQPVARGHRAGVRGSRRGGAGVVGAAQTILIVDDDVDFIATGRAALESAGYRVVAADDAESGFAAAMAERPGLILLDLMMEETDSGVRLAHQLRREPATKDIPIVILTGVRRATGFDFTPITREDYEWIGADAWVEKPVAPRALAGLAARVLEPRPDDGGEAS